MAFASRVLRVAPEPAVRSSVAVLVVIGEIDAVTVDSFRHELISFVDAHDDDVIVDMSDVRLIVAAGVRALLRTADHLSGSGRRLRLVCGPEVQRTLHAARVADVLEVFERRSAAVGAQHAALHRAAASPVLDGQQPEEVDRLRREVADLRAKLRTRPLMAHALGILRERYRLADEETARRLLGESSQRFNVKMRVLADALVNAPRPTSVDAALWFPGRTRLPAPRSVLTPVDRGRGLTPRTLLASLLDAALSCTGATAGCVHHVEHGTEELRLERHQGLTAELVEVLAHVLGGEVPCAVALRDRSSVVVPDVAAHPALAGHPVQGLMVRAGVRAVRSTPVLTPSGQCLAVVSTCHPRAGHVPTADELARLEALAAEAGRWLQWHQRTTVLDALEHLHQRARQQAEPAAPPPRRVGSTVHPPRQRRPDHSSAHHRLPTPEAPASTTRPASGGR
ncbi:STAS domain-containing protein [Saccharothrix coeruleofusca]|uniref:STAS domain-containing protein n=1 Tax=Saccharothrix coeruleofusca TaxID=33919 RepID=UPI001670F1FB|nr:STAS domain-containing protein [Saccharothrix coeruleofusca]